MTLPRFFLAALLALILASPAAAAPSCFRAAPADRPLRVLFVGNSLTYFNNMPAMVEAIAAANGMRFVTRLVAHGGARLHDHVESGEAERAMAESPWDYVVLQEQSTFGDAYVVDGHLRIRPTERWTADAVRLAESARAHGARPVLLAHWARRDSPEDTAAVEAIYSAGARRAGACLIRNSEVYRRAAERLGRANLYIADGLHPAPVGSYVTAAAIVRAIGGRPVVNVPLTVTGEPIEQGEGRRLGGSATLVTVDAATARDIAAWSASVSDRPAPGQPTAPAVPTLIAGERLPAAAALAGRWRGPIRLYPAPATLSVTLSADASLADVEIRFDAENARTAGQLAVTRDGDTLRFDFPQGPNGTTIRFEARYRAGALAGTAHFRSADGTLEGIGSWTATRGAG